MRWKAFRRVRVLVCGLLAMLILIATAGCVFVSTKGLLGRGPQPFEEKVLFGQGREKVLLMEIQGLISEKKASRPFQLQVEPSMVASIKEQLDLAARDDRIRGMLLMINSPGGTVSASDVIYNEIRRFKEKKKIKVVALLNGTATSGAYYVAQAADRIVAYPTTVTGSIGVILLNLNLNGLMEKIGVSDTTVTSGMYKDLGSPFRKPKKGEQAILQGVVDELYGRFIEVIDENRPGLRLTKDSELADGRIFTARKALSAGLIDQIGYVSDAVDWVRGAASAPNARVVRYQRRGDYVPNVYSLAQAPDFHAEFNLIKFDLEGFLSGAGPSFMYLWMPGV